MRREEAGDGWRGRGRKDPSSQETEHPLLVGVVRNDRPSGLP